MRLCEIVREIRTDYEQTQLQFGLDFDVTRETISKIENGHQKVPSDISRRMMEKFDDPRLAVAIQYEYTRTGPVLLNGPNVDLHRCSVKEKTIEELEEFVNALKRTIFTKPFHALTQCEISDIREAIELKTALTAWLIVATEYINISFVGAYAEHYQDLREKGLIAVGGTK